MNKIISIFFIILRLGLGGMMIYGGIQKFQKPNPTPNEVIQKASKFQEPDQENTLQKILYINGMKQTGYFWQILGICELLFGLLLVIQGTSLIGALFLLPITLHIFLFHLFLESDEIGELITTGGYLTVNILLVTKEYKKWKDLLWISFK
ncbi:DoxX family membrane protein [Aquimarina celericrescens]|uniref:DoxX family membrane protein n=1 Tax=Aquimarina celericrescens TaxID=1964542 RepID=A0ABW5B2A2_9FLAO|nr:DoxX family membrane protein [Aquimarina celericrescens]